MSFKERNLIIAFFIITLLLLGSPLLIYFIEENRCIKLDDEFSFMRIAQGDFGYFFFDENSDIHFTYKFQDYDYFGADLGWTLLHQDGNRIEICNRTIEYPTSLGRIYEVKGIKHKEWYYVFASGSTGFWSPFTLCLRSKNRKTWEPVPFFEGSVISGEYDRYIDSHIDANGNLIVCFRNEIYMMSLPYYSFYLVNITENSWEVETITYEGELSHLRTVNFNLWNNNPVICWSYLNDSLHYNELKFAIRKDGIWLNTTLSYSNQSLYPCGVQENEDSLNAYFYAYNFDGLYNSTTYTKTRFYKASINDSTITASELFYYPERLYFSDKSVFEWENGKYSICFEKYFPSTAAHYNYYAELIEGNLTEYEVRVNQTATYPYSLFYPQLKVKNDLVYLLWGEILLSYSVEPDIFNVYFAKFSNHQELEATIKSDPFVIYPPE